jgi:antitoxin VapB
VRLPKEFRFEGDEVIIKRSGNAVVLIPSNHSWDVLANSLNKFSADFMDDRNQPTEQNREDLFE